MIIMLLVFKSAFLFRLLQVIKTEINLLHVTTSFCRSHLYIITKLKN